MSVSFVQKEDLRDRMADLEKRLAESEEERSKLEKTCNVLMKAFREEERMQYKALNKKYEKFLEDCSVRKRRNDIILRSLCRIEDRSRVLFAKTERLKLLKNRYISDLKVNEYSGKKKEYSESWRSFSSPSQKMTGSFVKWRTPLETPKAEEPTVPGDDFSSHFRKQNRSYGHFMDTNFEKSIADKSEEEEIHGRKSKTFNFGLSSRDVLNPAETGSDCRDREADEQFLNQKKSMTYFAEKHISSDKPAAQVTSGGGRKVTSQNESVEKEPSSEKDSDLEADDYETRYRKTNEDDTGQNDSLFLSNFATSTPNMSVRIEKEKEESKTDKEEENMLPMGLDGVDYQNETYPESYYEQPVHHHNHTSIASDVILEEDETEQELDEDAENVGGKAQGHGTFGEPQRRWEINAMVDEPDKGCDTDGRTLVGGQSPPSQKPEKSVEATHEERAEERAKPATDTSDKNRTNVKSSLIHLLESDSESFQIEHGDVVSGNEDSDFDFSFNQN